MPSKTSSRLACPLCQAPLKRGRRSFDERADPCQGDLRRYRCQDESCTWRGLLPRTVRRPNRLLLRRASRKFRKALLPGVALAGFGFTLAAVAWQAGLFAPAARNGYALGEHHEGEPLPTAHALRRQQERLQRKALAASAPPSAGAEPPLKLRYSCVWGQPGRNPYRGSVEQALRTAALPEEVVISIAAQVRQGRVTDRLEIRNDGVHALGSGRIFNAQNIALTYGETLCLGARVNFRAGHVEPAALYEAAAANGRIIAVMVPEVCGNVSVLGQSDESVHRMRLAATSATTVALSDTAVPRWMPAVLEGAAAGGASAAATLDVPEPGTLACVLAGLGALALGRLWRAFSLAASKSAR